MYWPFIITFFSFFLWWVIIVTDLAIDVKAISRIFLFSLEENSMSTKTWNVASLPQTNCHSKSKNNAGYPITIIIIIIIDRKKRLPGPHHICSLIASFWASLSNLTYLQHSTSMLVPNYVTILGYFDVKLKCYD